MKSYAHKIVIQLLACFLLLMGTAVAEEGGSSHYVPGATASFIETMLGKKGFAILPPFMFYGGDASAGRTFPIAGLLAANIKANVYAQSLGLYYETPVSFLGGNYACAVSMPYQWVDVKAQVSTGSASRSKSVDGIGDITLIPMYLGWFQGWMKYFVQLSVNAPTGSFEKGRLANLGKSYWTFAPQVGLSYFSMKNGREFTLFTGFNFNTKNNDTDYQSGNEFHVDATAAQHFGNGFGIGVTGFYYQQITGDSGSGALLGDFKGRDMGVGPAISYITKIKTVDFAAELKWLPEFDVQNRTAGNWIWLKLAFIF